MHDLINGLFETGGGLLSWFNVYRLIKDKDIKGVFWPVHLFFSIWGWWNLVYYSNLDQWWSFSASIFLAAANTIWSLLAIRHVLLKRINKIDEGTYTAVIDIETEI